MLEWIGTWRVASATAISVNFALAPEAASRLLQAGCEMGALELVRLKRWDPVYRLTAEGLKRTGMSSEFRIIRRNMDYLSRRAHIAAVLSRQAAHGDKVINPHQSGSKALTVRVRSGGSLQLLSADLRVEPGDKGQKPTAVVLITGYQSLETSESLCRAWHGNKDVSRVILCANPDILTDLERTIDRDQLGDRIEAMPVPLSDYAKARNDLQRKSMEAASEPQQPLSIDRVEIEKDRKNYEDEREHWAEMREAARRRWREMPNPFEELSDTEWDALGPILRHGRPKRVRHWCGIPVNQDRDIINTLMLCEYLGRSLSEMRLIDGYASGEMCLQRMRRLSKRRLGAAWERLAEISPARGELIQAAEQRFASSLPRR
jgi:hypothetical protein